MTFAQLSLVGLVALLGPLLAYPRGWHLPVVLGELTAGLAIGRTGLGWVHSSDVVFSFLADLGFALMMFEAGTHVPVRDPAVLPALRTGLVRAGAVGVASVAVGAGIAVGFGIPHAALYAVLLASSSAALILPIRDSLSLSGPAVLDLLPQVAVADTVCIVALPLAVDPRHVVRASVGVVLVSAAALVVFLLFRSAERSGVRRRVHQISQSRLFAVELRIQLVVLFAVAALAVWSHVSIMLAGFALGIAVAGVGEPRRLAHQVFAVGEGFLAPLFFVWLGASLNLRELGRHPAMLGLGLALGLGAILTHLVPRLLGEAVSLSLLASAQLGVPVAAATIGTQLGVLRAGEASAFMLGAVITIGAAVLGGATAARRMAPVPRPADPSG